MQMGVLKTAQLQTPRIVPSYIHAISESRSNEKKKRMKKKLQTCEVKMQVLS